MLTLATLSDEIILLIATYFSISDAVCLLQTSKQFHGLLETHLWRNIDLHAGWNHGRKERLSEPTSSPGSQSDLDAEADEATQVRHTNARRTAQFFATCASLKRMNPSSWARCSAAVRSLHISLSERADGWAFVLSFTNLSTLCVHGHWIGLGWHYPDLIGQEESRKRNELAAEEEIRSAVPAFPLLTSLTLSEYIPAEYARLLLDGAESLTDLDLALLAPPLHLWPASSSEGSVTEGDDDGDEDLDERLFLGDALAISPLPLTPLKLAGRNSLRRLRFCKPAEWDDQEEIEHVVHNLQLEKAVLEEWASLLRAGKSTLEEIVFDLRPVVKEIWLDGMDANEPVRRNGGREPGDERFKEVVLEPVFFEGGEEKEEEWPRLRKVRFCGVDVESALADGLAGGGMTRLTERLGPDVEIECTPGLYSFIQAGEERTGKGRLL